MIPGNKSIFRLYSKNGTPLLDLIAADNEPPPQVHRAPQLPLDDTNFNRLAKP